MSPYIEIVCCLCLFVNYDGNISSSTKVNLSTYANVFMMRDGNDIQAMDSNCDC